ncbi:GerAB/ArcD/ProY family transporter [Paenibacillus qinlingensis]|uniref:GerAB/ArcD/ProY family transporter n=1 Tax=Paenibacillus qinlingensis TaxID=1837343 RepID=UPI0015656F78|nr:GerAB/ArcD/ProY family transporter [Paenibacillus qinlingensis]NQX63840.1 GerAB/ArcD/ProY family transporter [Paenibacillus qinlingensis]
MKQQGTVTGLQLGAMTFVFVFSTTIAFLISPLAGAVSFDGGLCIILASVVGTALATLSLRFALRQPSNYLGEYGSTIINKYLHKGILFLFSFFYLHLAAYILREFTDFFIPTYLRETPPAAVAVLVMGAVASLTQSGVSTVFRFTQGCFLFIGVLFAFKPLFFLTAMDTPMWYEFTRIHDWKALWAQTYAIIPWYGELIMFSYLVPELNTKQKTRRIVWIGSLVGTYILLVEFLLMMFFFGPKLAATLVYPALELTGFLHLGDFLRNTDALIVSIWFTGYFIKLSIIFTIGTLLCSQALSLRNYKPITFSLAAIVVLMSLILAKNPVELAKYFDSSWATFALFIEGLFFVYPLVFWIKSRKSVSHEPAPKP